MSSELKVSIFDMVDCLFQSIELINPFLVKHGKQTARIAYYIGQEIDLTNEQLRDLVLSAYLHIIGTLINNYETSSLQSVLNQEDLNAKAAYYILSKSPNLKNVADIINYNLISADLGKGKSVNKLQSDIIRFSCRLCHFIDDKKDVLVQVENIQKLVKNFAIEEIDLSILKAFEMVAEKDYFWLHIMRPSNDISISHLKKIRQMDIYLDLSELNSFGSLIARLIDIKSPNTTNHSYGVAVTAYQLGRLYGLSEEECLKLKLAGYLHDIGKLAIPASILDKPGNLTEEEYKIVKEHSYETYRVLEGLSSLQDVRDWAAMHHEKPLGAGYPFNENSLEFSIQYRILAVADVFSALREDRSYRGRLPKKEALKELQKSFQGSQIDSELVSMVWSNYDLIESFQRGAEKDSMRQYYQMMKESGWKSQESCYGDT